MRTYHFSFSTVHLEFINITKRRLGIQSDNIKNLEMEIAAHQSNNNYAMLPKISDETRVITMRANYKHVSN